MYKATVGRLHTLGIPRVSPIIMRIVPHDTDAFTQGLAYSSGVLYESTGLTGRSSLREISTEKGTISRIIDIERFWCEGIAIFKDKLFQLTYKDGVVLIYSIPELHRIGNVPYDGEGWGLTSSSQNLIMSNGSNVLTFRDEAFNIVNTLPVFLKGRPLNGINDIQYVQDRIYANIFYDTDIYEINMRTGFVVRIIDCSNILVHAKRRDFHDVLNGISYDEEKNEFFITGKNWPHLFQATVPEAN